MATTLEEVSNFSDFAEGMLGIFYHNKSVADSNLGMWDPKNVIGSLRNLDPFQFLEGVLSINNPVTTPDQIKEFVGVFRYLKDTCEGKTDKVLAEYRVELDRTPFDGDIRYNQIVPYLFDEFNKEQLKGKGRSPKKWQTIQKVMEQFPGVNQKMVEVAFSNIEKGFKKPIKVDNSFEAISYSLLTSMARLFQTNEITALKNSACVSVYASSENRSIDVFNTIFTDCISDDIEIRDKFIDFFCNHYKSYGEQMVKSFSFLIGKNKVLDELDKRSRNIAEKNPLAVLSPQERKNIIMAYAGGSFLSAMDWYLDFCTKFDSLVDKLEDNVASCKQIYSDVEASLSAEDLNIDPDILSKLGGIDSLLVTLYVTDLLRSQQKRHAEKKEFQQTEEYRNSPDGKADAALQAFAENSDVLGFIDVNSDLFKQILSYSKPEIINSIATLLREAQNRELVNSYPGVFFDAEAAETDDLLYEPLHDNLKNNTMILSCNSVETTGVAKNHSSLLVMDQVALETNIELLKGYGLVGQENSRNHLLLSDPSYLLFIDSLIEHLGAENALGIANNNSSLEDYMQHMEANTKEGAQRAIDRIVFAEKAGSEPAFDDNRNVSPEISGAVTLIHNVLIPDSEIRSRMDYCSPRVKEKVAS